MWTPAYDLNLAPAMDGGQMTWIGFLPALSKRISSKLRLRP